MNNQPTPRDPSHDILRSQPGPLDRFLAPQTVAVIGATENVGSVGRTVLANLTNGSFGGRVFPINPKRESVLGFKAYPNLKAVPDKIDLAVIVTPAPTVPPLVAECAEAGIRSVVIISAGFKEIGPAGVALEAEILTIARKNGIRIIGPNCLGVMSPVTGLNATFAGDIAKPGDVAFLSQSGALCTAVLDWSLQEKVGFSGFISVGSMLDVGWGDLIDHFGNDPRTKSIVIYMETVGNARSFLSAAREVALNKPIIVIKAGRTEAAAKAAASHTGSLTGSDEVLEAAFKRCGVLRVTGIADIFYMTEALAKQSRPRGPRLAILTNAGGPGVLAADALIMMGGELADLSPESLEQLNEFLPSAWSHNNPIDILGDADPARYARAVEIVSKDPNSDAVLVVLTPQAMTAPTQTAEALAPYAKNPDKPLLASWMGAAAVNPGVTLLNHANIPTFPYPDTAARVFNYMWRYSHNLKGLYQTPTVSEDERDAEMRDRVSCQLSECRASGTVLLPEAASKDILAAYGIPVVPTRVAEGVDQAVAFAREMGFPVVLKLFSSTITHKTDVGGVQLNLLDEAAVAQAYTRIEQSVLDKVGPGNFQGVTVQPMIRSDGYEIILGSSVDSQFGPVILFGAGGQLVEVFRDRALGLPPLNATLALRLMEQTKIFKAFQGVRGRPPVDMAVLEKILVRFSQLVVEQKWIKEIDINPLLVSSDRILALDARIVLHGLDVAEEAIPRSAIRAYPHQYIWPFTLANGQKATVRPVRPDDEPFMAKFHELLSEESVYLRYYERLSLPQRVTHERLSRVCFADYAREIPLVVVKEGSREILAVGRVSKSPESDLGEFAVLVGDPYQKNGLGYELVRRSLDIAREEKFRGMRTSYLPENYAIQKICERLGFRTWRPEGPPLIQAELRWG